MIKQILLTILAFSWLLIGVSMLTIDPNTVHNIIVLKSAKNVQTYGFKFKVGGAQ